MQIGQLQHILTTLLAAANDDGVIALDSGQAGPSLAITALTHGNEFSGLLTVSRIHAMVSSGELPLKAGTLQIWLANYEILEEATGIDMLVRHRGVDLNRVWGEDDPVIRNGSAGIHERAVRERLLPWLKNIDHLIDLHSTSQPSTPMGILVTEVPQVSALVADSLDVDWLFLNIDTYINGVAMVERHQRECLKRDPQSQSLSIAIEAGQHTDLSTIDRNVENVLRLMHATGLISAVAPPRSVTPKSLTVYRAGLARSAGDIIKWVYTDNPASFDVVRDGDEICQLHGESIHADGDTLIVMPRLRAIDIGDEMFYLAHASRDNSPT